MDSHDTSDVTPWPAAEVGAELLGRLAAHDPRATNEVAVAYLSPLVAHLRAKYLRADDHLRMSAAEDAIISLCKNPAQYNPQLRSLAGYLRMSAEGDLLNALEKERRHHGRQENWDSVELDAAAGNNGGGGDEDSLPSFDHPALAPVVAAFSPPERAAFDLMRDGTRSTAEYAEALGLTPLPAHEQAAEVKRIKDRLVRRLQRAVEGWT